MPSLGPTTNSFSTHRKMDAIGLQRNTNKIKSFEGLRLEVGFDRICCSLLPRRMKTHQREHAHLLQVKGLPSHVKALIENYLPARAAHWPPHCIYKNAYGFPPVFVAHRPDLFLFLPSAVRRGSVVCQHRHQSKDDGVHCKRSLIRDEHVAARKRKV